MYVCMYVCYYPVLTRSKVKKNQPISEEMVWLLLTAGKRKRASQDKSGATFYNLIQDITLLRVAKWAACPTLSAAGRAQLPS